MVHSKLFQLLIAFPAQMPIHFLENLPRCFLVCQLSCPLSQWNRSTVGRGRRKPSSAEVVAVGLGGQGGEGLAERAGIKTDSAPHSAAVLPPAPVPPGKASPGVQSRPSNTARAAAGCQHPRTERIPSLVPGCAV